MATSCWDGCWWLLENVGQKVGRQSFSDWLFCFHNVEYKRAAQILHLSILNRCEIEAHPLFHFV